MSRFVEDKSGKPYQYWGGFAYGEFNKDNPVIFRYPQKVGVRWYRDVGPALKRVLRKHFGLKGDGFWNIDHMMVKPEEMDNYYKTTKIPKLNYNEQTKEFDLV